VVKSFPFVLILFLFLTLWKGVRIVPQGEEWVVERLGKYLKTLMPGLHILVPYIDNVSYKVTTKDLIMDIPQQEVITRDNAVLITNAIAFVKVTDTQSAVYGVTNFQMAVMNLVQTSLRSIHRRHGSGSGAFQPRSDQGASQNLDRRRCGGLGVDAEIGGDSGHFSFRHHAEVDGVAGGR
jgi:hypothetical protein